MKNLLHSLKTLMPALVLAAGHGYGAAAGAAGEITVLPEYRVEVTRDKGTWWETPSAVTVVPGAKLRLEQAPRTVPEALKYETGTMIQKTGHGQGSPYIRGFTGFRTLLLVDGVRVNNSVFRDGPNQYWNTVDPLGLSRLELAKGPFSALYGSGAIGGTVNAVTKGVSDYETGSGWARRIYYRGADAESASTLRAEASGYISGNLAATLGCALKSFGDLEGGRETGKQEKTGYDERNWDAKIEFFPWEDTSFVLARQGVEIEDAWRTHKTIYGIGWEGLTRGNELARILGQNRELTYLQGHWRNLAGRAREIHAGVSLHRQEEERFRRRSGDRRDRQGFEVVTAGAFFSAEVPCSFAMWTAGGEYYRDRVDSFKQSLNPDGSVKSEAIQGPVADNASYENIGAYLRGEKPAGERLDLIAVARYDYSRAEAGTFEDPQTGLAAGLTDDWNALTGAIRALYALGAEKTWNICGGLSQGVRAPNLSDLTRLDTARTNEIETPAPGLDPEWFTTFEAGIKARFERFSGQCFFFHTCIDGMIVRTPTGRLIDGNNEVTKRNAGDGYVRGLEIEAAWKFAEDWTVRGSFTWLDGEVETYPVSDPVKVEEPLSRLMPPSGRLAVRWHPKAFWLEAGAAVAAKADKLSTRDKADTSRIPPGGTPGYEVFELRAGWRVKDNLSISAAVENITDEDYRIHGSGVNEPGRNFVLAAEYAF